MTIILILYLIGAAAALVINTGALLADLQSVGDGSLAREFFIADMFISAGLSVVFSALWPVGAPLVFFMTAYYRNGFQFGRR